MDTRVRRKGMMALRKRDRNSAMHSSVSLRFSLPPQSDMCISTNFFPNRSNDIHTHDDCGAQSSNGLFGGRPQSLRFRHESIYGSNQILMNL